MSLNSNNQQLQTILDTVNALPEAGGSSAPETCTVTIVHTSTYPAIGIASYTRFVNGETEYVGCATLPGGSNNDGSYRLEPGTSVFHNVVVGSTMLFTCYVSTMGRIQCADSNCNYISVPQNFVSTTTYSDPDSIQADEGTNMGTSVIQSNGQWNYAGLCLRPLGDTTVTIWDAD